MKTLITLLTFSLLAVSTMNATVWRVNNNENYILGDGGPCGEANVCAHCFSDLQAAIICGSVAPGDTLHVEASMNGTNYGNITISKPVVLIGTGYFLGDNEGQQASLLESVVNRVVFATGSDGAKIRGLKIIADLSLYFSATVDAISIERCQMQNVRLADWSTGGVHPSNLVLSKNYISGFVANISNFNNHVSNLNTVVVSNNYIGSNLALVGASTGIVANNVIGGNVSIQAGISSFYNNICLDATFPIGNSNNSSTNVHDNIFVAQIPDWLDVTSNFFGIAATAVFPVVGTPEEIITTLQFCANCQMGFDGDGTNDALMGVYGGIDPYKRAGIPAIPTIFELQNTNTIYPGGEVNVSVSTKVNH